LETRFNCIDTSSMGRLFDAVASILGICHLASYEGQAAIELEMASDPRTTDAYEFGLIDGDEIVMDPAPVFHSIVRDIRRDTPLGVISARFHGAVANCIAEICSRIKASAGINTVALTGGVFQNVRLLELSKRRLQHDGFTVLTHHLVPPNDGGLSLGQAVIGLSL
jgi:hydrogenase maturation protein HypF